MKASLSLGLLLLGIVSAQSPCMDILFVADTSNNIPENNFNNDVLGFYRALSEAAYPTSQANVPRFGMVGFGDITSIGQNSVPPFSRSYFNFSQRTLSAQLALLRRSSAGGAVTNYGGLSGPASGIIRAQQIHWRESQQFEATRSGGFAQVMVLLTTEPISDRNLNPSQVCCVSGVSVSGSRGNRVCAAGVTKLPAATTVDSYGVQTIVVGTGEFSGTGLAPGFGGNTVDVSCLPSQTSQLTSKAGSNQAAADTLLGKSGTAPLFFQSRYSGLASLGASIGRALKLVCDGQAGSSTPGGLGDPHFVTSDGLSYTFNGIGDFRYLALDDGTFDMQVRTHITGNTSAALSGLAFTYENNLITALWNGTFSDELTLAVNEINVGIDTPEYSNAKAGVIAVRRELPNGRAMELMFPRLGFKAQLFYGGRASFQLDIPLQWRGKTIGLAGNTNGDPTDDLRRPDGSMIPHTASARTVHYEFGLSWLVEPSVSLFRDFNYAYIHKEHLFDRRFVPVFETHFSDPELQAKAEDLCKGSRQCLYDAAATGSLDYAELTLKDQELMISRFGGSILQAGH